jgi:endonuclease YncB( thermonuclease family)
MTIRIQPVDPGTGAKCGTGQIVSIDSLKVEDLFAKVSDVFGKKCTMVCQNGVVIENDDQLRSLKSGDILDATFALSCNVQPVDPRTGNPIGDAFSVDLSNCKVNDLKQAVGQQTGRVVARVLHNGQLVGTDDQLHNVRSGETIEVAYAPVQIRVQPVDPKTGQPNARPFLVQLAAPDIEDLKTKCSNAANGRPVLGLSHKGQRLTSSGQLESLRNGDTIAIAYQQIQQAPPPQPEVPKTLDMHIFVQPLDPKTGQPFGQAFSVTLDALNLDELKKKVSDGAGGRPLQALTHRGQIVKGDDNLQTLRSGDAIGAVFGRNLKVTPMDSETQQPIGETFNVMVDTLKLDDLKNTISQSSGREVIGLTYNGNPLTTDAQLQYLRNGDALSAVFAPMRREVKQDKTGDSVGEDWDEEEDERETEEDRRVKSELALIMMELWEPKGDERVEDALRRLLFLAQRVRNRKLIRIAGAIPILVNMLKSADPSLKLTSCQSVALECVALLSKNVLNRDEIRKNGGLSPMVSFIHKKEKKDKIEALKCLKECSKAPKNKTLLRKAGFIETLIPYLLPNDEPVQCLVLDVLTVVCFNDQLSQQAIRDAKGIPPVIQLIKTDVLEVRKRAVRTLGAICGNNRKIQGMIRKAKAIELVVPQLGHKDEEIQKAASGCIAAIADNDFNNQNTARKAGAVRLLIGQLNSKNDSVKEQACAAIRALAKNNNAKVQADVREAGALKTLIELMKSPSEGVLIHATGALMELARDSNKNSDAICFGGAVPLLVSGLHTSSPVLQYHAEGAIWAIARKNKKRKEAFQKAKAIPPLKVLAQSPNEQVKRGAQWALDVLEK